MGAETKRVNGVCLFGGHHVGYPRSAVILEGLRRLGVHVASCTASPRRKVVRRYASLAARYRSMSRDFDVIFVPEFRHKDVALAAALASRTGKRLIFDPLVSRFDTRVHDRRDTGERGMQAWHNHNLDRFAMGLADTVLADTNAHARYFARELAPPDARIRVLEVGYDDALFAPAPPVPVDDPAVVLFYGSYLPLHGVDVIVAAAARLRGVPGIRFELIGGGQTYPSVERLVREERLVNVSLEPRIPLSELPLRIARSSICLGVFGTTAKAGRVIPNKVYQCMGMDRAVITAGTEAASETFHDDTDIVLTKPGDAEELARAIEELVQDAPRRVRIARAGGERVRAEFSPVPIARRFVAICEEALSG